MTSDEMTRLETLEREVGKLRQYCRSLETWLQELDSRVM